MLRSKKFRVATEGATTDGREISRAWIEQMARTYDPKRYGARIWIEHMRSTLPDGMFPAMGDVISLSADKVEDGKLALFAEIEPTPALVAMNRQRQKVYSSIEIDPDFADSGEAYLVGLGVTDSPASLGTEMLAFSAKVPINPLSARKVRPENLFSSAAEVQIEFVDVPDADTGLLAKVTTLLNGYRQRDKADHSARFADVDAAVQTVATAQAELGTGQRTQAGSIAGLQQRLAALEQAHATQQQAFAALQQHLNTTPAPGTTQRPTATGGVQAALTDC